MPSDGDARVSVVVGVDGAGRTHRLVATTAHAPTVRVDPADGSDDVAAAVTRARETHATLLVDDAHLLSPTALEQLAAAVRAGADLVMSRRPTIATPELGALDTAAAAQGAVVELAPLTEPEVAAAMARATGAPVDPDRAAAVHTASGGLPVLVVALADGRSTARVTARVGAQLARAGAGPLALLLASGGVAVRDDVLAHAAGVDHSRLAAQLRELRDAGLLTVDGERLIPAVADAVLADATPAQRREAHDALARAMLACHEDIAAAEHLRAAGARTPDAASAYAGAGERVRYSDPAAAASWYDLALASGVAADRVAVGRAEAALLLGRPVDVDDGLGAPQAAGMAIVAGVAAAHHGRAHRAAELLCGAPDPGPVLAVPSLMATGQVERAKEVVGRDAPTAAQLLAEGALALSDPVRALPLLIEAAEAYDASPGLLLPDTPHAVGAVVAVAAGDVATAEDLLEHAVAVGVGGPYGATRHRLLLAWARLRAGRHDTARAELHRVGSMSLPGRERLLSAALVAGLARRSGEASQLREAWAVARPVLARRAVDLLSAEPTEELLVAAARLREPERVEGVLDDLAAVVDGVGGSAAWPTVLGWCRLHVAVATDDVAAAGAAATMLGEVPDGTVRHRAQRVAAGVWAAALAGEVDGDRVRVAADDLAAAGLPWEASRLCGHAAIRTTDAAAARHLLSRARELVEPDRGVDGGTGEAAGLSEREIEVARLVLAGQTHKEIGAQLFLSPKTIEHHVARIRSKLGAGSRAELMAALRSLSL